MSDFNGAVFKAMKTLKNLIADHKDLSAVIYDDSNKQINLFFKSHINFLLNNEINFDGISSFKFYVNSGALIVSRNDYDNWMTHYYGMREFNVFLERDEWSLK